MKRPGKSVRATLGPKILANVDRYFTNDLAVIATELLQNCRRAGATAVEVSFDRSANEITVSDNGRGLEAADAGTLLIFGGSANNDVVENDEGPAGMGFFSLAMRGATVRSADWEMSVTPAAFIGQTAATMRTGITRCRGMSVTFPADVDRTIDRENALRAFGEAATFMPLAVRIDGTTVKQRRLTNWLRPADAASQDFTAAVDVASATVGDCIVVVARYEDGGERWAKRSRPLAGDDDDEAWLTVYADIFGKIIRVPVDLLAHYEPVLEKRAEEALLRFTGDGVVRWPLVPGYLAAIEAIGQATIKCRLPDRRELVRTPELGMVVATIVDLVTTLAGRAARNAVAHDGWPRFVAVRHGIEMRAPQVRAFVSSIGMDQGFALETGPTAHARRPTLALVAEGGKIIYRLAALEGATDLVQAVDPGSTLEQALLRTATSRILVCHNGAIEEIDEIIEAHVVIGDLELALQRGSPTMNPWPSGITVADDLALELKTSNRRSLRVATEFLVADDRDASGLPDILARRSASIGAIVRECVGPADDQILGTMLRQRLTTALRSPAQAAAEVVRDALLDAGLTGVGGDVELVALQASLDETTGLVRLAVSMSDGSSAVLDVNPDATVWED